MYRMPALVAALALSFAAYAAPPETPASAPPVSLEERHQACGVLVDSVVEKGYIYPALDKTAILAGRNWARLNARDKQDTLRVLSCWRNGGRTDVCTDFEVRHWSSRARLGKFENCTWAPDKR